MGFWRNHREQWTSETLARIQATEQRYDGKDGTSPNGVLSSAEMTRALVPGGNIKEILEKQLLATLFNLATRRINASTVIHSATADRLGLANPRAAVLYAVDTLKLLRQLGEPPALQRRDPNARRDQRYRQ